MYIILMRHGAAEAREDAEDNRNRRLTGKGERGAARTADMLRYLLKGARLAIFTSPYRRTKETAEIVCDVCGGTVEAADELLQAAWGPVAARCLGSSRPVLLVGHQPFLQSYLMIVAGAAVKFTPASAAIIDYDPKWRQGRLIGFISPDLKKMKKAEKD